MSSNNISPEFRTLSSFLTHYKASNFPDEVLTHTRIGDKDQSKGIYGGKYAIPQSKLLEFHELYYQNVFVENRKEYLTEVQPVQGGALVIDLDFRYSYDEILSRPHTKDHVEDIVSLYIEKLNELYNFNEKTEFNVFVFEKPNINRIEESKKNKDGIHILMTLQSNHIIQQILRDNVLKEISERIDLPLENDWSSVLDKGISTGTVNWQLYGSCKPNNETYKLVYNYLIKYDESDNEPTMEEIDIKLLNLKNNFTSLTVQNPNIIQCELSQKGSELFEKAKDMSSKPKRHMKIKRNTQLLGENDVIHYENIKNAEQLHYAMNVILEKFTATEHHLKEIHEYVQILPGEFYEDGTHLKNRSVAFALKNTDYRLFLSWIMLRAKADDFDYETIGTLYQEWCRYFNTGKSDNGYTFRSIIYWAKNSNPEEYEKVKYSTIQYYIDQAIDSGTEYDMALVLKHMYKDKYVCVSLDKKGTWFVFKNHKWVEDNGLSLRNAISTKMYDLFVKKLDCLLETLNDKDISETENMAVKKKTSHMYGLKAKLKKTSDKNNIIREAAELFYDDDFLGNMDQNPNLLCFKNGVVDFSTKVFRNGQPEDYLTKCTNIDYISYDTSNNSVKEMADLIDDFMSKIFPVPSLKRYMWEHLASCLIGVNLNQTFNIYHGSGSNGKSMLSDLMGYALGDYKGTVPVSLITEQRGKIGNHSDEVNQLKGVRYAVMQEPSKGAKMNEGPMKELTGGDTIQTRGIYKRSETFKPQFSMVVCLNHKFEFKTNDDGSWRRVRICDFIGKFVDEIREQDPEDENSGDKIKYVFLKDKSLPAKLIKWAPVFAGMLVQKAFETDGLVEDCDMVTDASNKYRKSQDHINKFINLYTVKIKDADKKSSKTKYLPKNYILKEFRLWFASDQGDSKPPKGDEITAAISKKYGDPHEKKGWANVEYLGGWENNGDDDDDAN